MNPVYKAVSDKMENLANEQKYIVVTGSVGLMLKADFVFVQTNGAILRNGYNQSRERQEAMRLGEYVPVDWYLGDLVRYDPDCL